MHEGQGGGDIPGPGPWLGSWSCDTRPRPSPPGLVNPTDRDTARAEYGRQTTRLQASRDPSPLVVPGHLHAPRGVHSVGCGVWLPRPLSQGRSPYAPRLSRPADAGVAWCDRRTRSRAPHVPAHPSRLVQRTSRLLSAPGKEGVCLFLRRGTDRQRDEEEGRVGGKGG